MISLYCTPARVNMETGGGATTVTELAALREVSEVGLIIAGDDLAPWHQKVGDSPFLEDYYALEQIKDRHFDIAHFYGGCFTQTARVLKERGTKISWAAAAHDRKVSIEEFQRLGMEYPFNHMSDDRLFEMYTEGYRLADIVLSSSHKSAGILRDMGCKRVKVVPGGIELPKKVKPIPSNFDVGYLGALGPDKGVIYLIQGWGMLNYPDSKLMLAGWGTDTLETFIRQVSNQGNFALLGRVPDVADFYNAISIYIQPSVTEGCGLEIPEAMSYGRVVIAAEGAGAAEIIEDGVDGFVVPIRDPKAIADKIDWCKRNRQLLPEMGERAKKKASNYTWDKIRKQYVQILVELMKG